MKNDTHRKNISCLNKNVNENTTLQRSMSSGYASTQAELFEDSSALRLSSREKNVFYDESAKKQALEITLPVKKRITPMIDYF